MSSKRKPPGYWEDFGNLERELLAFIEECGIPGSMPTHQEFQKAKRSILVFAIQKHGGSSTVAERLGLKLAHTTRTSGYWDDFFNLKREILAFIDDRGAAGMMPTRQELQKAGLSSLGKAISQHGGFHVVAEKLGLKLTYVAKPRSFWKDFSNLSKELFTLIKELGNPGIMPTIDELIKSERKDIVNGIKKHGGFPVVAEKLGLKLTYVKKINRYWDEFSNVERGVFAFIEERGTTGVMPTSEELRKASKSSLAAAISQHGGFSVVAERLGLTYATKSYGYWKEFSNVEYEVFKFIKKQGTPGMMPTSQELTEAGQSSLVVAIQKYGGCQLVAEQLGLSYAKKSQGYWDDFSNVERELLTFINEGDTPGVMPTTKNLKKAGKSSLAVAISDHGGFSAVAEKLGLELTYTKKTLGYWDDFSNLEQEILTYVQKHGTAGVMPIQEELKKAGRNDLTNAIRKHGGYRSVAERLGLELAYTAKPPRYWDDFAHLERELLEFIINHGTHGVMPKQQELKEAGRNDLNSAITKHGGFLIVARKLGLTYISFEYITPRTASEVEKTARAIQPLAESNLLSGGQVMVILRRAGLLEYRNKRVVRLGASLARGNHDEIETAISQLASTSEEITTETDNIEESENLTAEEAEALVNSGLESTENPPLDKSTPEPDTQREQAVIRGLTALGALRLPLDEVLSLLTSKLLWQAFYKRLYNWYGGLDAAQNITAEDVEAAILSIYPEHTENEFVAEASARFTLEVEQAVNFAASLPNYDWHGFRVRLHQADAARRMTEILTNQDSD
ncbi:MAG: hypothetical protein AB1861_11740, partial [Cyanobacteriota bacterium]